MDNHTPDEFEDDAPAPDFCNSSSASSTSFHRLPPNSAAPEFPQLRLFPPPVEPSAFQASDTDLSQWAEHRLAVYGSLDAALNRHITEAINALGEFKRQAEAEAAQAGYKLVLERDRLRQEVDDLQQEQTRLQQALQESRYLAEAEEARQAQAKIECEELERELNWLKTQLEEARRAAASAATDEAGGEGRRSGVRRSQKITGPLVPVVEEAAFATTAPEAPPVPVIPAPTQPDTSPVLVNLEEKVEPAIQSASDPFGDALTPRILGGSPVLTPIVPLPVTPREEAPRPRPGNIITSSTFAYLQELLMGDWPDLPLAEVQEPPASLESNPSPAAPERPRPGTGPLRFGGAETADVPRRGQTDQLGQPKRRRSTESLASETVSEATPPVVVPGPGLAVVNATPPRKRGTQSLSEAEKSQKVTLRELGIQLGLTDPMTPPAVSTMSFAQGYTPPSGVLSLADLLDEIKANASAITPRPELAITPEKTGRRVVEPPPPISLDQDLTDYNIDEERVDPTLQELLEAGEQELAAINDDPTPPENPTPFIGKIGADHPVHFQPSNTVTPRPEPLSMLNQEIEADSPITQSLKAIPARIDEPGTEAPPTRSFRPLGVRPLRPRPNPPEPPENLISFPLSLPFQPELSQGDTIKTQVKISNLPGRYSLQMLERVLRDLVGVAQVIVTEFGNGVLVMEVIHRPNLNLVAQLLSLPQLPLKLKEEGTGILVFIQENRPGENG